MRWWFLTTLGSAMAALEPNCTEITASTLTVSWQPEKGFSAYYVQLSSGSLSRPFALRTTVNTSLMLEGLSPNVEYTVAIRGLSSEAPSEAWGPAWSTPEVSVRCVTRDLDDLVVHSSAREHAAPSPPDTRRMRVYRISEYSFDVDFLRNHDAASIEAMPLYLMTCDPEGDCSPWDALDRSPTWDACHAEFQVVCPTSRGAGFNCMECAEANRAALTAACGNWSTQDTMEGAGSFAVHWWCGVGWPESAAMQAHPTPDSFVAKPQLAVVCCYSTKRTRALSWYLVP
jgi:hypothetical protein